MSETETEEFPRYDSCRERGEANGCAVLKHSFTQIGEGYSCPECQMTYVQVDKGAFIPFDQALEMAIRNQRRAAEKKRMDEARAKARARKKSKGKKKRRR